MEHGHQHGHSIERELECVSQVPIFQSLAEEQLLSVAQVTRPIHAVRGGAVFNAGEVSQTLYIVNTGQVRLYHLSAEGKEQVLRVLNPGDFVGEIALFTDEIHGSYAEATMTTELCTISRESLTNLISRMPPLSMHLLGALADRLKAAERQATLMAIPDALPRLAGYLQVLSHDQSGVVDLPMSKQDLAAYLGMTPESLSRKLHQLVSDGVIETIGRRQIKVLAVNDLAALAPQ
ncbi:Crp-like transcriptional regulator [Levilactobacillus senmaizukei DSM 21775 = NBRC 103853]|uniref:Crp-like transcriptional regulator n=1 Tax=Levilactobacillus senmaizukei DSM 21775 = NBRC 103853 TaxID=1423803 RepID=A0A0R2DDK1_9LACO|nr:Crp/Fnr family transcriptional regulator [Levilactobacillus senmaizukei]KRN02120.1 Crp-like transcriptional regulator [Levilactobacillus senmaizukei DSM 21775 = NBRC 103853]